MEESRKSLQRTKTMKVQRKKINDREFKIEQAKRKFVLEA